MDQLLQLKTRLFSNLKIVSLKEHIYEIKELLMLILSEDFLKELEHKNAKNAFKELVQMTPFFYWTQPQTIPTSLSIVVLLKQILRFNELTYLNHFLRNYIIIGKTISLCHQRNFKFHFEGHESDTFTLCEFTLKIEFEDDLEKILKKLASITSKLRNALSSRSKAFEFLEKYPITIVEKINLIEEEIFLVQKKPFFANEDIPTFFNQFLRHLEYSFINVRKSKHLSRIFLSHLFFVKAIKRLLLSHPHLHHIKARILPGTLFFPIGVRHVLGIVVTLNLNNEKEVFNDLNLIKAIETLLPNIRKVKSSFISYKQGAILNTYIEIEKHNGAPFTYEETKHLKNQLVFELTNHIEELLQSVFKPRNEEEIFQYLVKLSNLLKTSKDVPKAMILFDEQQFNDLRFICVLVRPILLDDPSLSTLLSPLQPQLEIQFDQVKIVGTFEDAYVKEANIFKLHLKKNEFLRNDYSIDLQKAYDRILEYLTQYLGPIEENFKKQQEKKQRVLDDLKKDLQQLTRTKEFLLENFFYAFWQSNPDWHNLYHFKKLFLLFLTAQKEVFQYKQSTSFFAESNEQALFAIITSDDRGCGNEIEQYLNTLSIEAQNLNNVSISYQGIHYFGFIYQTHDVKKRTQCLEAIKTGVFSWLKKQKKHQVLNLALPAEIVPTLDPYTGYDYSSGIIMRMLYEGLMRHSKNGGLEYGIAHNVSISKDYKTYRFFLRECYWSNEVPVTAHDFVFGWKKLLDPSFKTLYGYLLFIVKNAKKAYENACSLDEIGVIAEEEKILKVELEHPSFSFLEVVSHFATFPINSKAITNPQWSKHAGNTIASNGPFKLKSLKIDQGVELIKNPLYWDAKQVQLQKIQIHFFNDEKKALDLFLKKEIDCAGSPFFNIDLKKVPKNGLFIRKNIIHSTKTLICNCEKSPFSNKNFRKTIFYAVHRKAIVKMFHQDLSTIAHSILPEFMTATHGPFSEDGDLAIAKKYLNLAQKELKLKFPLKISFDFYNIEENHALVQLIVDQLKKLNIELQPIPSPWEFYFQKTHNGDFSLGLGKWYLSYNDPTDLYENFKSKGNRVNTCNWENPYFSELIEKANAQADKQSKKVLLDELEKILKDELPLIPLYYSEDPFFCHPYLQDLIISKFADIDFKYAYINKNKEKTYN